MFDIQDIYNRLLAARYQETLFSDLAGRRSQGQETTATCPFCEKAGKFSYNATRPVWKCWRCVMRSLCGGCMPNVCLCVCVLFSRLIL